ncbi:hypothetical protein GCM10022630_06090 [Thermobifida alba]
MFRQDPAEHLDASPAGQVDVEQDQVGTLFTDDVHRSVDVTGLPDDLDGVTELAAYTAAEQPVVVDDHDPRDTATGEGVLFSHVVDSTRLLPGGEPGVRHRTGPFSVRSPAVTERPGS